MCSNPYMEGLWTIQNDIWFWFLDTLEPAHAGHDDSLGSFEYLVYENVFKGVAASVGLSPVLQYGDRQLDPMLDPVRTLKLMNALSEF